MGEILRMAFLLDSYPLGRDLLLAWFCLEALAPERAAKEVLQLRNEGAERQVKMVNGYARRGIRSDVLLIILGKKLQFLAGAATKAQVQEILRPSVPAYSAGEFRPRSAYHVEEEEMLLWSFLSEDHALNYLAEVRAMELFERYQERWNGGGEKNAAADDCACGGKHHASE